MRTGESDEAKHALPPFSHGLNRWFMAYVRRYLRKHFHAVRVLRAAERGGAVGWPEVRDEPLLIYTNHPGWWDPLLFLYFGARGFPGRMSYGPIDAKAVGKYKFLQRIGFIPIEPGTWKGSATFLRTARAALSRSDVIFWVTAQGEFADPRARPVVIRPGVGHAVAATDRGIVVPLAVEYPFWTERCPEAVAAFGTPMRIADAAGRSADTWTDVLADELTRTQERLAEAVIARDPDRFITLMSGKAGVGPVYDTVRRLGAWFRGKPFDASHGGDAGGAA
jgi:1-acyl-sn-glycerol-3-phosphate acyltransferase